MMLSRKHTTHPGSYLCNLCWILRGCGCNHKLPLWCCCRCCYHCNWRFPLWWRRLLLGLQFTNKPCLMSDLLGKAAQLAVWLKTYQRIGILLQDCILFAGHTGHIDRLQCSIAMKFNIGESLGFSHINFISCTMFKETLKYVKVVLSSGNKESR